MRTLVKLALAVLLLASWPGLAGAANLTLAWDPPPDWSPAGYIIFAGPASGDYVYRWDIGATTTYTLINVPEGGPYYFAVAGYDARGVISNLSEEISTYVAASVPAEPPDLEITSNGLSPQVVGTRITWVATARGGVAPYQYQWAFYKSGQWNIGPWTSDPTTTWTPSAAGEYQVQVRVRSAGSTSIAGELAKTMRFTVTEKTMERPRKPPPARR